MTVTLRCTDYDMEGISMARQRELLLSEVFGFSWGFLFVGFLGFWGVFLFVFFCLWFFLFVFCLWVWGFLWFCFGLGLVLFLFSVSRDVVQS